MQRSFFKCPILAAREVISRWNTSRKLPPGLSSNSTFARGHCDPSHHYPQRSASRNFSSRDSELLELLVDDLSLLLSLRSASICSSGVESSSEPSEPSFSQTEMTKKDAEKQLRLFYGDIFLQGFGVRG
jgi:hypothetical protein